MIQMYARILPSCILLLLSACTQEQVTGPGQVRWDRETCTRCNMAVGDRAFAAQVRAAPAGEKSQLYKFDDIGCAVIWLTQQKWKDDATTEIWVTDHRNGAWIEARQAFYIKGKLSPMNYGLGAQADPIEGTLDFAAASEHIYTVENTEHKHKGHMH